MPDHNSITPVQMFVPPGLLEPIDAFDGEVRARELLEKVRSLRESGFAVPGGSRFDRYAKVVAALEDGQGLRLKDALVLQQAGIEIDSLCRSIMALRDCGLLDEWRDTVTKSLKGTLLPDEESPSRSSPRDFQFEVNVAGLLAQGGYRPMPGEPDIRVRVGSCDVAVAVKRARSSANVEKIMRRAARQLADSRSRGVLAIDVTRLIRERGELLTSDPGEMAKLTAAMQCTRETMDQHLQRHLAYLPVTSMAGLLVFSMIPMISRGGAPLGVRTSIVSAHFHTENDARTATLQKLSNAVAQVMTGHPAGYLRCPGDEGYVDVESSDRYVRGDAVDENRLFLGDD